MVLIVAACAVLAAAWLWRAYFRPFRDCRRCKGSGKKRTGRRFRNCWKCNGAGRYTIRGSKTVQKAVRSVTGRRKKEWK